MLSLLRGVLRKLAAAFLASAKQVKPIRKLFYIDSLDTAPPAVLSKSFQAIVSVPSDTFEAAQVPKIHRNKSSKGLAEQYILLSDT